MGSIEFDFADETVLVTGASSGIGRAIALEFAAAGAMVINADRREEPRDEDAVTPTHELIREDGGEAAFVETDVSEPAQLEAAIELTREYGGLNVMVNNAGVHVTESVLDITEEQYERLHDVNVKGCLFGCQAAAREMLEPEGAAGENDASDGDAGGSADSDATDEAGCIINMASISSTMAKPRQIGYESTKGAIRMITRSAALELAPDVRVNALAPGRTATEFGASSAAEKRQSVDGELLKPIPMGRAGVPDDLTGAALFLASDRADYVTGEVFYVDGGYQVL